MRSNSLKIDPRKVHMATSLNTPKANLLQNYDGFTSDYYSYHIAEKMKHKLTRKVSYASKLKCSDDQFRYSSVEEVDRNLNKKNLKRIVSIPVGYQFDYKTMLHSIKKLFNLDEIKIDNLKNLTVISIQTKDKIIFIFEYGVLLLWGFDEEEEIQISDIAFSNCKLLIVSKDYNELLKNQNNFYYFTKGETFNISNRNKITIESNDLNEIMSIAYALGQNTILCHYELEVANTIEETKRIPIEMRDKGEITLSKKEISRNIGLIFMRRSAVNLNSDILDTPDIFWDQKSEFEQYYSIVRKFFEIDKRLEIMDKRMKILKELYDVMNNEIKTQGKFRLEWIVVYLIVIEIFVSIFWKMLVKDILKLY